MTRRRGVAYAGAAAAAALACASLGYRDGDAERAARTVVLQPALASWELGFERDRARLKAEIDATERWLEDAEAELSRMQASIVQIESLAARLVERARLDAREFDFTAAPGVGGPEERSEEPTWTPRDWHGAARGLSRQVDDRRRQMQVLDELLKWRDLRAAVMPDGRPVHAAYVSSRFGPRIDPFTGRPASHKGIDFAGAPGSRVVAVAAGIVTSSGARSGYGKLVEIDHGNGLVTRYAHNSKNLVEVGDVVTRGQAIARIGATGRATGPNLHFEVLQDGEAVDPLPFIE